MHLYSPPLLFRCCSSFLPPFLFLCFVHCPSSFFVSRVCLSIDVTGALDPLFTPPLFVFLFGFSGVSCTGFYCSIAYGVCLSTDVTGALPPPTSHRTCESVHRRDRVIRTPSSPSVPFFVSRCLPPFLFSSCFCTRVSVHRRDWCTCACLPPFWLV